MTLERSPQSDDSNLPKAPLSPATPRDKLNELFPVVGIGASAGRLEAFTQLLNHLPLGTGIAFVLVQHLDPNQKSLLSEILARTLLRPGRITDFSRRATPAKSSAD